jgi:hypothetical protein
MTRAVGIHREFDFEEGTSAKWIFNIEIEKLRSKAAYSQQKDQNRALCLRKGANRAFKSSILDFVFTFPELTFHDALASFN